LFFVIAMVIYNFLVFSALVTVTIAAFLAPLWLAAAASRFVQPFLWEWIQVVLHAGVVLFIAQAIMGIVVAVSVIDPINKFAEALENAQASGSINVALENMRMPIVALVGLGVGIFALLNVQGIASSFVGRVESVGGATAAAMFMAVGATRLAGAALRFGDRSARSVGSAIAEPAGPPPRGGQNDPGRGPGGGGGGGDRGGGPRPGRTGGEQVQTARSYEPDPPRRFDVNEFLDRTPDYAGAPTSDN
jgi:hypothetical protein